MGGKSHVLNIPVHPADGTIDFGRLGSQANTRFCQALSGASHVFQFVEQTSGALAVSNA